MQTPIAQAAALTIFGNDLFHGYSRTDFWPASTVFTFCKSVRFVTLSGDQKAPSESPFTDSPIQWISRLRDAETVGLRIHHVAQNDPRISDRTSAGFVGGGGRWLIESLQTRQSDLWEARWQLGDKDDPGRKIWDVAYCRVDKDRAHLSFRMKGLTTLQNDLKIALSKIETFASRQKLELFAKAFRDAGDVLSSAAPLSKVYHSDLAPTPDIPLEAKQLLGAAQVAWVFGGMGSWNDMGFEGKDQQEYNQLSDDLFSLLTEAICGAVNSSSLKGNAIPE